MINPTADHPLHARRDHLIVLIQEDRACAQDLIEAFARMRVQIEWFACPRKAEELLFDAAVRRTPPDLVLAEEEAVGRAALIERLRTDRRLRYVPFIVLTREPKIPVAVVGGGVNLYVRRPSHKAATDALVEKLLCVLPFSG